MYKLVIQDDEGKTTVVPLIRDELTIGRKEGNSIRLTERNVSRRHARLLRQNGSIAIEDLNSYNGIRVNGTRIQGRASIKESDRVQIGDYLIELKSESNDKLETLNGRGAPVPAAPEAIAPVDTDAQSTSRIATKSAEVPAVAYPTTEPIALADTDPGAGRVAAPSVNGRLVALSSLFAGQDFSLDKPAIVIGRTDDNDVTINHRSISRHHAKVVRENGRYAIVDLQSSNGVRVNGEEYGKVELRRGDLIDLGHVRLRFVEPGEDFLFGRDAHAVEMTTSGGGKSMTWIILAVLVVVGAVVAFLAKGGDGPGSKAGTTADARTTKTDPGPAVPDRPVPPPVDLTKIDAGVAVTPSNPPSNLSKRLELARQAVASERWKLAIDEAKAALALDPGDREAKAIIDQASAELGQEALFAEFTRAVKARQMARVAEIFRKIDTDSLYRVKAQPDHDRLQADYVRMQGEAGRKLAERGKCREQKRLSSDAEKVWGPSASAAVMAHLCKEPVVAPPDDRPPDSRPPPDDVPPPDGGPSADELLAEAKAAAKVDQFAKALRLCQAALTKRPGDLEAAQTCVIAACNLRSVAQARKYLDKVKSASRVQMLKQLCMSKGVDLN